MGVRAYVIGGYVRDRILGRPSKDIDVVVEGDGPALARRVGARTGSHVAIFARFGTAMIHSEDEAVELSGMISCAGTLPSMHCHSLSRRRTWGRCTTLSTVWRICVTA